MTNDDDYNLDDLRQAIADHLDNRAPADVVPLAMSTRLGPTGTA